MRKKTSPYGFVPATPDDDLAKTYQPVASASPQPDLPKGFPLGAVCEEAAGWPQQEAAPLTEVDRRNLKALREICALFEQNHGRVGRGVDGFPPDLEIQESAFAWQQRKETCEKLLAASASPQQEAAHLRELIEAWSFGWKAGLAASASLVGPPVTFVRQRYSDDCGLACLAMIAGVEYEDAIGALGSHNWQQKIVTSQMPYFLGALGVAVREVYPDCGELVGLRLMCVKGHYVVVLPDNTVHDPARGPNRPLSSPEYAEPFQVWECHRVAKVHPDFLEHRCVPTCDRCLEEAHKAYLENREP